MEVYYILSVYLEVDTMYQSDIYLIYQTDTLEVVMKRQHIRKLLITISLLLFPVTIYYLSPVLIINAGLQGIINGSFIVFLLLFVLSFPLGRVFCAYLCPGGGLQECAFSINNKKPEQGWRNNLKYIIWIVWIAIVVFCYLHKGGIAEVNFLFETQHGISVSSIQSYIIYYGIVLLILLPSILFGKRVFCHYFCWMAPFMVIGTKIRRFFHLPGLHIRISKKKDCISCGKCSRECPMGLDVEKMIKEGQIGSSECIQCGACIDSCALNVLSYGLIEKRDENHGNRKKT